MDFLKAAVAETKQGITTRRSEKQWKKNADSDSDSDDDLASKKFLRRGEVNKLKAKQEERERKKRKVEEKCEKIPEKTEDSELNTPTRESKNEDEGLHPDQVKRMLRFHSRPITLFGETDTDRFQRLRAFELELEEKHGGMAGMANNFDEIMKQQVLKDIQDATLAAMESEKSEEEKAKEQAKKARMMAKKHNKYAEARARDDFDTDAEYLIFFFKRVLSLWELELDQKRSDEDKRTNKGKVQSATQKQTRSFLQPFFKKLKKNEAPPDVVKCVTTIVDRCYEREYVLANEAYLTMSIGNAAWPMGVTSVGIHERAGRERIFCHNQAHILNDETSRKYIQAIKRIMTYCQHAFPNVPSKMVV